MRGGRRRTVIGAGVTVGATIAAPGAAQADTFNVTNLLDDGSPGTLRTAVDDAQANPGFDRILFSSGLSGTITLLDGDLEIDDGVEIVGPGHARVTVDGNGLDRIFSIYPAGQGLPFTNFTISGLTLTGGDPGEDEEGGAIFSVGGRVVVEDSVITGNTASDGFGGAVASKYGSVLIDSSVISGNSAEGGGGLATKYGGTVTVDDTTIVGNTTNGEGGGGINTALADTLVITDSTLSGNSAPGRGGGGIAAYGSSTLLSNSTVSGNSAEGGGGVLAINYDYFDAASKFTTRNSTIAQNSATEFAGGVGAYGDTALFSTNSIIAGNTTGEVAPNVGGEIDAAFTLVNDPAGGVINETTPGSNLIGVDPGIGPLASNGGPTQTHALLTGSPALDAGNGTGSNHDQRAQSRPVELPNVANSTAPGADGSDIGAYEAQADEVAPRCRGKVATIVAVPGVPTVGTDQGDVIIGTDGADQIDGRGGGDLICGWAGNDRIGGGAGNDTIVGQFGEDDLEGGGGRDRLGGGAGNDEADGGKGRDGLIGGPGNDELRGGGGPDRIFGKAGNDTMFGNGGPDRLRGGPGADRFNGGPGANVLFLIRGDGDRLFGDNADSKVVISDRPKRKLPPN